MKKRTIEDFEKYKPDKDRNYFTGHQRESGCYSDATWVVDGTGRAINAMILVNEKVAHQKIFSYDSMFDAIRDHNYKEQILEALEWAWLSEGLENV